MSYQIKAFYEKPTMFNTLHLLSSLRMNSKIIYYHHHLQFVANISSNNKSQATEIIHQREVKKRQNTNVFNIEKHSTCFTLLCSSNRTLTGKDQEISVMCRETWNNLLRSKFFERNLLKPWKVRERGKKIEKVWHEKSLVQTCNERPAQLISGYY